MMLKVPCLFCMLCEDILCERYVTYEMIFTVLRQNILKSIAVYSRGLRHSLIPEICCPDGGVCYFCSVAE
jgi:hypothetical protein